MFSKHCFLTQMSQEVRFKKNTKLSQISVCIQVSARFSKNRNKQQSKNHTKRFDSLISKGNEVLIKSSCDEVTIRNFTTPDLELGLYHRTVPHLKVIDISGLLI